MPKLILTTEDKVTIAANYNKVNSTIAVILVHMLNRTKEDWNTFAQTLNTNNFATLAIDIRGHGQSGGNWQHFKERDFQNIILDIKAAKTYLEQQHYTTFYIIGASIGANTALRLGAADPTINKIVLLSPGENYRGVTTFDAAQNYQGKLLIVSSKDDPQSYTASEQIARLAPHAATLFYTRGGHGTTLLTTQPELAENIITFLKTK